MSLIFNKSDKKTTKISKIYLSCVPANELLNQLLSTGKTKLQCKTAKLVKASLMKIILDPHTPHFNLPLFKHHVSFQNRYSKRGIALPELSDALAFYEEIDGVTSAFQGLSCAVTSTPKVKTRAKPSCFSSTPILQRGFLCEIKICFINLNFLFIFLLSWLLFEVLV